MPESDKSASVIIYYGSRVAGAVAGSRAPRG
jgi:hypothetical protein